MNRIKSCFFIVLILSSSRFAAPAAADTFGSGANSFDIDFVTIGNPGNPPDANGLGTPGAVPYEYLIGRYEISEQMIDKANALGAVGITKDTRGPDYPVTSVTWYEAAKFVNWLNTSTGSVPAYKFDSGGNFQLWQPSDPGYDSANRYRNKLAKYVVPTFDEWHKAAYYNPASGTYYTYPTGSDNVPDGIDFPGDPVFDAVFYDGGLNPDPNLITNVGIPSPYQTLGQGGNADEWLETAADLVNNATSESRIRIGGSWVDDAGFISSYGYNGVAPFVERPYSGFRVASAVPEPSVAALVLMSLCALMACRRKRAYRYCISSLVREMFS